MKNALNVLFFLSVLLVPAIGFPAGEVQSSGPDGKPPAVGKAEDPCRGDIEKLCAGVVPGEGRIIMCLKSKYDSVSPACRARIEEGQNKFQGARKSCEGDIAKFCKDVKPGGGRIVMCLRQNAEGLTPECRQAVDEAGKDMMRLKKGRQTKNPQ